MELKHVCKYCGSDNVRRKYWGNVNGDCDFDASDEYWCCHCEDYTDIVSEDEYRQSITESAGLASGNMLCYMVYECDVWLSKHSQQLIAICSSFKDVRMLLSAYDRCSQKQLDECVDNNQSQCGNAHYNNNFYVQVEEMNILLG